MLSAALKEMSGLKDVTGLFDSRTWTAAVLPMLFFVALTAASAVGLAALAGRWPQVAQGWKDLDTFGQGVILTVAVVVLLLGGIWTANLHYSIIRFWEGYAAEGWVAYLLLLPTRPLFWLGCLWVLWERRNRQRRFDGLAAVAEDEWANETFEAKLLQPAGAPPAVGPTAAAQANAIRLFMENAFNRAVSFWHGPWDPALPPDQQVLEAIQEWTGLDGDAYLMEVIGRGRQLLLESRPLLPNPALDPRYTELLTLLRALANEAAERAKSNAGALADIAEMTYRYDLPPGEDPLPTSIGRAIRSAEAYPQQRYGADAVLVWPRLAPLLPKEFADRFASAEAALSLTTTLTTFALVFGLPMALATTLTIAGNSIAPAGWRGVALFAAPWIGTLVLTALMYGAAANAAVEYGDQIRAAFDLYRGKVLEQMGFRPPPTIQDERKTWAMLNNWLLVNQLPPDPVRLAYLKRDTAYTLPADPVRLKVPVPIAALPNNHLIVDTDLKDLDIAAADLPLGTATVKAQLVGQQTCQALAANQIIPISAVVSNQILVPVAIPAGMFPALALINLGDRVSVSAVPAPAPGGAPAVVSVGGLIVMTVSPPAPGAVTGSIVLAVPNASLGQLTQAITSERFVVARQS